METKMRRKALRREFSASGWVLLLYWAIMNAVVSLVAGVDLLIRLLTSGMDPMQMLGQIPQMLSQIMMANGWGYIISGVLVFLVILLWKKPDFLRNQVFAQGKPMSVSSFFLLLCLIVGCQGLSQIMVIYQETLLNLFGRSLESMMESLALDTDSFSMFLYGGIVAPVIEEILCRGVILRSLSKYGKKLAILGSAFLFAILHGNIIQTPFAFAAGLILGYVALEYSILWSMVLHMFNNMIVADLLSRMAELMPMVVTVLQILLIAGCFLLSIVFLVVKRREIRQRSGQETLDREQCLCFFTSPGVLVITAVMWGNMLMTLFAIVFA